MSQLQGVDNKVRNSGSVNRKHATSRKLRNQKSFLGIRPRKLRKPLSRTIVDPGNRNSSVIPQPTFSLEDFAERTQVQGVKDWYYAHSKTSACAYFTIVLLFSVITVIHVGYLAKEYWKQSNTVFTSIEYDSEANVRFPEYVQLCMEQFIDPRRVAHYMIQTLVQHPNITMDEFVNEVFPYTDRRRIDKHLNGTELKNIANVLDVHQVTQLLSNGSGYLNSILQVAPLIKYYAKTFQHWHLDKISGLFSFVHEEPHNVISAISAIHRDNLNVTGHNTSNVTVGRLSEIAGRLSFYHSFYIMAYCAHGMTHNEITANFWVDDSKKYLYKHECKLQITDEKPFVDVNAGLCLIYKVNDARDLYSISETIKITVQPLKTTDLNQQFPRNQSVQVRLSSHGIHTVDYAVVEMGTKSAVTYDAQIWNRENVGNCVDKNTTETLDLLGRKMPYDPTTCRFSPKYWESADNENDWKSYPGKTKCNCMKGIASYMVNEPWASLLRCDEVWDLRRGRCNGKPCPSATEERSCQFPDWYYITNGTNRSFVWTNETTQPESDNETTEQPELFPGTNCSYTQPKCLEPAMRSLYSSTVLEMKRSECQPWCFETEFTAISTTIMEYFERHTGLISELNQYLSEHDFTEDFYAWSIGDKPLSRWTPATKLFMNDMTERRQHTQVRQPMLHLTVVIRPRKRFNTLITSYQATTFFEAASEIGGAISLFLGASIFSMVHLFLLLLNGLYTCSSKWLTKAVKTSGRIKSKLRKNKAQPVNG